LPAVCHTRLTDAGCWLPEAGDDKLFWLIGFEANRHWAPTMRAIGKHEWLEGGAEYEKYKSAGARRKLEGDIVAEMDAIFATKPLEEWGPLFDAEGVWWCPVQDPEEVAADEQAIAAGACVSPSAGRQPTCRFVCTAALLSALCSLLVRSEPW